MTLLKFKTLLCKLFRHKYVPLIRKTGLQLHRCTRCGDEVNAILILAGETYEFVIELEEEV